MSFHCFPRLPKEIRQAIWRRCLPHRILEIDTPYAHLLAQDLPKELEGITGCNLQSTTGDNSMPPIISRVCFESRAVAFETGRFIDFRKLWDGNSVNSNTVTRTCWFDPARDVIHLHWNRSYEVDWMSRCEDPIPVLLSLGAEAAQGASLSWATVRSKGDKSMDLLKQAGQSYMLCLPRLVSIHASIEDAVESGLFGVLGEERVVLVDAGDDARIRLFDDFNRVYGSSEDRQTAQFFQRWRAFGSEDLKREKQSCDHDWLFSQSVFATPRWEQKDLAAIWTVILPEKTGLSALPTWIPDWDHEWVKRVLKDLPSFRPVYMMRLCRNKCT